MTAPQRTPPCDIAAERALLGCAILESRVLVEIGDRVSAEDFYHHAHRLVWAALQALSARGAPVDTVTLRGQLGDDLPRVGGDEALLALTDVLPSLPSAEHYAHKVARAARVRRVIQAAAHVQALGYEVDAGDQETVDAYADEAERQILEAADELGAGRGAVPIGQVVGDAYNEVKRRSERGSHIVGIPTGLDKVDWMLAGLRPGRLYVVAGRPGMGKTALGLGAALNAAKRGQRTLFFSLEMPRDEIGERLLSSEGQVGGTKVRTGRVERADWPALTRAAAGMQTLPFSIDDSSSTTVMSIRSECRRQQRKHGLHLAVVDYVQIMESVGKHDSREREVASITRGLKRAAKEFGIPVVALCQLNRGVESRQDKRPQLSDLRESGAIEQDADAVLFLYRDEVYHPKTEKKGIAEVQIAKQRGGPTGTVEVAFDAQRTSFVNLAWREGDEDVQQPSRLPYVDD